MSEEPTTRRVQRTDVWGWIAPSVAAGLARCNHHFGRDPL